MTLVTQLFDIEKTPGKQILSIKEQSHSLS